MQVSTREICAFRVAIVTMTNNLTEWHTRKLQLKDALMFRVRLQYSANGYLFEIIAYLHYKCPKFSFSL